MKIRLAADKGNSVEWRLADQDFAAQDISELDMIGLRG